jgi:hypothetical protein
MNYLYGSTKKSIKSNAYSDLAVNTTICKIRLIRYKWSFFNMQITYNAM